MTTYHYTCTICGARFLPADAAFPPRDERPAACAELVAPRCDFNLVRNPEPKRAE
jgi:DNA-directed RNA polymerase subunit RPC12/RpoP